MILTKKTQKILTKGSNSKSYQVESYHSCKLHSTKWDLSTFIISSWHPKHFMCYGQTKLKHEYNNIVQRPFHLESYQLKLFIYSYAVYKKLSWRLQRAINKKIYMVRFIIQVDFSPTLRRSIHLWSSKLISKKVFQVMLFFFPKIKHEQEHRKGRAIYTCTPECKFVWVIENNISIRVETQSRNLSEKCFFLFILMKLSDLQGVWFIKPL
jgi:hypothetical protein